jgi:hypothetical protein
VVQRIFEALADVATPMQLSLMAIAGLLSRYWDTRVFAGKRQDADARVARGVGLALLIAAPTLYVLNQIGRMILLRWTLR